MQALSRRICAHAHRQDPRRLRRGLHPGAQGPGARQAAPGHVHPHRQPAAHRAGGHRQRRRRSAGGIWQAHRAHAACRRLGECGGRWPRHPLRRSPRGGRAGGGDRLHPAACGWQVRQGLGWRLQLLGRSARRGRERDQRTGPAPAGHGLPRGPGGHARLQRRRRDRAAGGARARGIRPPARHHGARLAGCEVLRGCGPASPGARAPAAQQGGADAGRDRHAHAGEGGREGCAEPAELPRGRNTDLALQGRPARLPHARPRRRPAHSAVRRRAVRQRRRIRQRG